MRSIYQDVQDEPSRQYAKLMAAVVVCSYTEARWAQTRAAIKSVLDQEPPADEVILVVDHNEGLADHARHELPSVTVLESDGPPGLSGARNTGLKHAQQPVTVFLDDDAEARPGWLSSLLEPYRHAEVVATGGSVHPRWADRRPRWLPATFDWVIGCSYAGLPQAGGIVRNPIGANMSVRTQEALAAGAFDTRVGRVGAHPRGCEETELAIRLTRRRPGSVIHYVPDAAVDHHVPQDRLCLSYFLRRCWYEGQSKADVVELGGASAGLESERRHAAVVIPSAILKDMRMAASGDVSGLARSLAAAAGLTMTTAGYLTMRIRLALSHQVIRHEPDSWPASTLQTNLGSTDRPQE